MPGVVDELKEAEIDGQLFLGDAAMGTQPGAQQRPEPFHRIDVDLAEPVAIVIAGIFAGAVADSFVAIAPGVQAGIDVVLIGVDQRAAADRPLDDRLDRDLLDVGQQVEHDFTTALDQSEDRRLLLLQGAAATLAFQPSPASLAAFF